MAGALARAWQATQGDRDRWAMRWRKGPGLRPVMTAVGLGLISYGVWTEIAWLGICLAGVSVLVLEWRISG